VLEIGGDRQELLQSFRRVGRGDRDRAGRLVLGDLAQRSRDAEGPPAEEPREVITVA
jgi:hypothetical protein